VPSIADVYTTVFPETSKIAPMVTAAFREVDSSAREAGRRWGREIQEGLGEAKINLNADTSKAKSEIDEAAKDRKSTVEVDADTAKAAAQIDAVARDRHSTIEVSADQNRLAQSVSGAMSSGGSAGISALQPALLGVGITMAAGIASALSGLSALIPAGLLGAGGVVGTLVVGLDGVKDAWDAAGKAAKSSGADQAAQTKAVTSAQRSLKDAVTDEARAQKDVANARKDALHQLQDLNLELRGGALDEKQAQLDLAQAQQDLATGTFSTSIEYQQAQLRVLEMQQRVDVAHQSNIDMQEKANDARAKGVDGADNVVAANDRLAQTQERVADAQQKLVDAFKPSTDMAAAAQAMAALSPNAQAFINTLQGMKPAFDAFKFGIQDALFANLGPQFQQLAATYMPLLQSFMTQMATVMNQSFGQIASLLESPQMVSSFKTIFSNLGAAFQAFMPSIGPMVQAFTKLTEVGSGFLPELGQAAVTAAQGFNQFIQQASQSGQLQQWIQTGITALSQLGDVMTNLAPIFLNLAPIGTATLGALNTLLVALQPAIQPLATAFASLITALSPALGLLGQIVSQVIVAIAPAFTQWFNAMGPVIQQVATALTPVIAQLAPVLGQVASVLSNAMIQGINTLLPVLIPFVQAAGNLLVAVSPLLPALVQLAISALPSVQQAVATILPVMTEWMNHLTDLANIVIPPLTKVVEFLATTFGTTFDHIKTVVGGVWDFLKPILETMKSMLDDIVAPLKSLGLIPDTAGKGASASGSGKYMPKNGNGITPIGPPFTGLTPDLVPTGGPGNSLGTGGIATAPPAPPSWGAAPSGFDWDAVAKAESSGNWANADTGGNGHFGGLQFSPETWKAFGGTEFAPMPNMATREQQIEIANRTAFTGYNGAKPQGLGAWETITKGMVPGVTVNTPPGGPAAQMPMNSFMPPAATPSGSNIYSGPHVEDTHGAIVPRTANLESIIKQYFPGATISNDYRNPDGFNEHSSGEAVDIAVNPGGKLGEKTAEGQALGTKINEFLIKNADALGLQYSIWQGMNWDPDGSSNPNSGQGITGGHWDHVHGRVKPGPADGSQPLATDQLGITGGPSGNPTDPMYVALSPNIPAGQQKGAKGDDSGAGQLGQDFVGGIMRNLRP
jgi:hypothetical protein